MWYAPGQTLSVSLPEYSCGKWVDCWTADSDICSGVGSNPSGGPHTTQLVTYILTFTKKGTLAYKKFMFCFKKGALNIVWHMIMHFYAMVKSAPVGDFNRSRPKLNYGAGRDFGVGPEFGAVRKEPIIPGNSRARSCAGEEDRVT